MKYLVIAVVVGLVLWFSLRRGHRAPPPRRGRRLPPPQQMVRCAHCGVHLPAADALAEGQLHYCSPAHRALGARPPR